MAFLHSFDTARRIAPRVRSGDVWGRLRADRRTLAPGAVTADVELSRKNVRRVSRPANGEPPSASAALPPCDSSNGRAHSGVGKGARTGGAVSGKAAASPKQKRLPKLGDLSPFARVTRPGSHPVPAFA